MFVVADAMTTSEHLWLAHFLTRRGKLATDVRFVAKVDRLDLGLIRLTSSYDVLRPSKLSSFITAGVTFQDKSR
jgi:hypothetical protein